VPQDYFTLNRRSITAEDVPHFKSTEEERFLYDIPCNDDHDYGPIYTDPPTKVEKIYELFEGKKFHKLYHKDVK